MSLELPGLVLRGRREHRKHLTRRELLAAGRRLFAEQGLYDSRIEDLSRLAGVAKGTLYGYFANKEELIEAVVTQGFNELLGKVHRAALGATSRREAIGRIAEAHVAFFAENPDLMRIFHQLRGLLKFGGSESRSLRAALSRYLDGLADVIEKPRGGHRMRAHSGRRIAMVLFGAISGVTSIHAAVEGGILRNFHTRALVRSVEEMVRVYGATLPAGAPADSGMTRSRPVASAPRRRR